MIASLPVPSIFNPVWHPLLTLFVSDTLALHCSFAILAQLVEYLHDMQGVTGSSPVDRTICFFRT